MNSFIMLFMVLFVIMFGLLNDNFRFNGLQNYCIFIRISVCVIYYNYSYIIYFIIMYFKVILYIVYQYYEFLISMKIYLLFFFDQRRFGLIIMVMLLGVILFLLDFLVNLVKNLIKYL